MGQTFTDILFLLEDNSVELYIAVSQGKLHCHPLEHKKPQAAAKRALPPVSPASTAVFFQPHYPLFAFWC
jgi:hypothetical protein